MGNFDHHAETKTCVDSIIIGKALVLVEVLCCFCIAGKCCDNTIDKL